MRRLRKALLATVFVTVASLDFALAMPTIRRGDEGPLVQQLQDWLRHQGYRIDDSGIFGRSTDLAVRAVQRSSAIRADGIVSVDTWLALARRMLKSASAGEQQLAPDEAEPRILPPVFAEEASPADANPNLVTAAYTRSEPVPPAAMPAIAPAAIGDETPGTASVQDGLPLAVPHNADLEPAKSTPGPTLSSTPPPATALKSVALAPIEPPLSALAKSDAAKPAEEPSRNDILIDIPSEFETSTEILGLRSPRMTGKSVTIVQALLGQLGYKLDLDGIFGTTTVLAVKDFQRRAGQKADGRVGRLTREALVRAQPRREEPAVLAVREAARVPEFATPAVAEKVGVIRKGSPAVAKTPSANNAAEAASSGQSAYRVIDTP